MINKLKYLFTARDKQILFGLLIFSIIISIIEMVGISVIMPFISVATDFSLIRSNEYYSVVYTALELEQEFSFVIIAGFLLVAFYILRGFVNYFYFFQMAKFSEERYHALACRLFDGYMKAPYCDFSQHNTSVLMKSIVTEASNLTQLISAVLLMLSEIFVLLLIYLMMLYVNWEVTFWLTIIFALTALLMLKVVSIKIHSAGVQREILQKEFYEILNRSFGNFIMIKLMSSCDAVLKEFSVVSLGYTKENVIYNSLAHFPRLFIEVIGFGVVIFIVMYLVWEGGRDISDSLPMISMFVLALYRLMPSVNRIMSSFNQILFYRKSLDVVYNDLMHKSETLGYEKCIFENVLDLNDVSFGYDSRSEILKDINLSIKKGEILAFVGESGSGKSTLVDVIVGLYKPTKGCVEVDGVILKDSNMREWRKKIGYIPQSVYLFDGTVGENVAFEPNYDRQKVDACLRQVRLYDYFNEKDGQDTRIGENGVKLSGGQRQRIAIARALYNDPEILVLDEATSALDKETESTIMDQIYEIGKSKTVIIIAHRLSSLVRCDRVLEVVNKGLVLKSSL